MALVSARAVHSGNGGEFQLRSSVPPADKVSDALPCRFAIVRIPDDVHRPVMWERFPWCQRAAAPVTFPHLPLPSSIGELLLPITLVNGRCAHSLSTLPASQTHVQAVLTTVPLPLIPTGID